MRESCSSNGSVVGVTLSEANLYGVCCVVTLLAVDMTPEEQTNID